MTAEKATAIKVFFCYAEADKDLRGEIEKHLSPLRRLKQLTGWFYRDILAGTEWIHEIEKRIDEANLILLLVSPDFIYSDSCYSVEMQRAIERHKTGRAHVIPIILRPVLWEETFIGELQVLPVNRIPITQCKDRDTALLEVAQEISKVVKMLLSKEALSAQETEIIDRLVEATKPQSKINQNIPDAQKQLKIIDRLVEATNPQPIINQSIPRAEAQLLSTRSAGRGLSIGRVLNNRYLLQRLLKQGQYSTVYCGTDTVLQRPVTVKIVPASYIQVYRSAIKLTAQFSHPNIVGLYDLVIETDALNVVQEYVEGDDFATLLQKPLAAFEVADLGSQICQSLMYANNSANRVAHGDLTPGAVIRDRSGLVRVNNFALPCDQAYFQKWCVMGGDDVVVSDTGLPNGTLSKGRQIDDVRATGLLLYQLLAGRAPGAGSVEPRLDGRLSFQRNIPPELCETVARAVVRRHPLAISTPEELFTELKILSEALEASVLASTPVTSGYMYDETIAARPPVPAAGAKLATALSMRDIDAPGGDSPYQSRQSLKLPVAEPAPSAPTVADGVLKLAAARRAAYPEPTQGRSKKRNKLV